MGGAYPPAACSLLRTLQMACGLEPPILRRWRGDVATLVAIADRPASNWLSSPRRLACGPGREHAGSGPRRWVWQRAAQGPGESATGTGIRDHGRIHDVRDHARQRGARTSAPEEHPTPDGCLVSSADCQRAGAGNHPRCRQHVLLLRRHSQRAACSPLRSGPVKRVVHCRERAPRPTADIRLLRRSLAGLRPAG